VVGGLLTALGLAVATSLSLSGTGLLGGFHIAFVAAGIAIVVMLTGPRAQRIRHVLNRAGFLSVVSSAPSPAV
jgi:hypothetical protein